MNKRILMLAAILGLAVTTSGVLRAEEAKPAAQGSKTHMHAHKKHAKHAKMEAKSQQTKSETPAVTPAAAPAQTPK